MRSTEQEPSLFSRASSPQKSQKPAQHTSPSAFKTPSRQYSIRLSSGWVAEGVTRTPPAPLRAGPSSPRSGSVGAA